MNATVLLRTGYWLGVVCALLACTDVPLQRPATQRTLVLIGGPPSEGPGRHDYPAGVRLLQALLESSPDVTAIAGLTVRAYPDGWPDDPRAFDDAATVVWYFDGLDRHPLRDPARRAQVDALMQRGVGLVALHQSSTVPLTDDLGLPRWLGATRRGLFDRTTETAHVEPADAAHPVLRGVEAFAYRDEFYPSLQVAPDAQALLQATLHPQFRDGVHLLADTPERTTLAWARQRADGGRSFVFSGAHFLAALDEPMLRKALLNAIFWTARFEVPEHGVRSTLARVTTTMAEPTSHRGATRADALTFHRDAQRSGWHAGESVLSPARLLRADAHFGEAWSSLPLDAIDGSPARLYASPLYVDRVRMSAGPLRGETFSVVFAASNNGFVYAVNAAPAGDIAPGRILWRSRLATPCRLQPAPLDGVATGVLATPVIDLARQRLYVTSCDPQQRWQAYALDLGSGAVAAGWPVRLDEARFNAVNRNAGPAPVAPTRRFDFRVQRGALNLSPDGTRLYVTFGESETGWLVAVDTASATVASAFAAVAMPHRGSGGIWGAGGAAVDATGQVFVVTGTGFDGHRDDAGNWAQSVLALGDSAASGLTLRGSYTPFNHCASATMDIDLGSGGAMLIPDLDPTTTTTPRLLALGGKQGNVYLLDRTRLPGRLDRRQPCSDDAAGDASLLPPQDQPQFGRRGPLNVFGPYSDKDAALNQARGRSVPAYFGGERGTPYLFVTGNTRQAEGSSVAVAPSLVRLAIDAEPGRAAYLRVDGAANDSVFRNPGSPVVTSNGPRDAIVWVLDENADRSAPLVGADAPQPVLYAYDALSLALLWRSAPGQLATSGKYNEPAFGRGQVFVGTDRIQAFGFGAPAQRGRASTAPTAANEARVAAAAPRTAPTSIDGRALYQARCAACHDNAQGSIPPRALIAARAQGDIVRALTDGAMRGQAQGLHADEIDAIARHLKTGS